MIPLAILLASFSADNASHAKPGALSAQAIADRVFYFSRRWGMFTADDAGFRSRLSAQIVLFCRSSESVTKHACYIIENSGVTHQPLFFETTLMVRFWMLLRYVPKGNQFKKQDFFQYHRAIIAPDVDASGYPIKNYIISNLLDYYQYPWKLEGGKWIIQPCSYRPEGGIGTPTELYQQFSHLSLRKIEN